MKLGQVRGHNWKSKMAVPVQVKINCLTLRKEPVRVPQRQAIYFDLVSDCYHKNVCHIDTLNSCAKMHLVIYTQVWEEKRQLVNDCTKLRAK